MARQATTPVSFQKSRRYDRGVLMTSGRAAKVYPMGYIPLLRGDSASGRVQISMDLAEMPKPLLNGVTCNMQAWFVPKSAHPQFAGLDEFNHSYTGEQIKALGQPDRDPPKFFDGAGESFSSDFSESEFSRTLGWHFPGTSSPNFDVVDAFALIYNFRLAAYSSRLQRRNYWGEGGVGTLPLPRAFWPANRLTGIVPDYERALVVGALDMDVSAGKLPIEGLLFDDTAGSMEQSRYLRNGPGSSQFETENPAAERRISALHATRHANTATATHGTVFAEMAGSTIGASLADIDKARTTQAFAKLRTAYAGNDATGFDNDDVLVALLMQGLSVPPDQFKRPWLLDSKRVPFGFAERFATDAGNLDQSVSQGRASAMLSINVPANDVGGLIIFTCEVMPERIDERMTDEWVMIKNPSQLPNALRDVQRTEPVDLVLNRRVDARHTDHGGLYGYEPMNSVWNRDFTRLGGAFYQADPNNPFKEQRAGLWQASIVNPVYSSDHFLAPENFPHDVFADANAPAWEAVVRHDVAIVGLTQIGDVLAENNHEHAAVVDVKE